MGDTLCRVSHLALVFAILIYRAMFCMGHSDIVHPPSLAISLVYIIISDLLPVRPRLAQVGPQHHRCGRQHGARQGHALDGGDLQGTHWQAGISTNQLHVFFPASCILHHKRQ